MIQVRGTKKKYEMECFIKNMIYYILKYIWQAYLFFNSHLMMRLNTGITLLPNTLYGIYVYFAVLANEG